MFLYKVMWVQNGGENMSVPVRNIVPLFHTTTNYTTSCDFTHAQLNVIILILMLIIIIIIIIIIIQSIIIYLYSTLKPNNMITHPGLAVRNFTVVTLRVHVPSIFSFKLDNYNTK
jgi:hypothetical protein